MSFSLVRNSRVLVIDDTHAIHDDIRKVLAPARGSESELDSTEALLFGDAAAREPVKEFTVDSAYQGREGLEKVRQAVQSGAPYAVAFVDIRMPPGWDGITTIGRLWRADPNLEVVVCTAYSDYSWSEMVADLGHTDRLLILKKPFDNAEVRQMVCALTEKWNLARKVRHTVEGLERAATDRDRELLEQKRQLEKTHSQLLHSQKLESIGQLAAGIAHEINTPIQYVGDNTRFLRDGVADLLKAIDNCEALIAPGAEPPARREWADRLSADLKALDIDFLREELPKAIEQSLDGLGRVTRIVRAMKDFSHPGAEGKEAVDLNHAIESTITVARNEWKYVAELVTDFDPELPLVSCVAGDFNQVILNMVVNAAHAIADVVGKNSGEKGTITIATKRDGDRAEIRISDTGTGIPEKHRSRVFDHFFTTKEVGKGTGQGLAIAHSVIVENHGGEISFETEAGRGTTFIVRLPVDAEVNANSETSACEEVNSTR
jgi:two-component system NtrC family sensor kinase